MNASQQFPAKLLLFGEYVVLAGGDAIAMPLKAFGVRWVQLPVPDDRLRPLLRFLWANQFQNLLNLPAFETEIAAGWQLQGNVPQGYGLGSSGTVCAAVWGRYAREQAVNLGPRELHPQLARMEAFYHGNSSGTDPLVSFTRAAWRIRAGAVEALQLPENWHERFFLVDTQKERNAAPLIHAFKERYANDTQWKAAVDQLWKPANQDCISALLQEKPEQLTSAFLRLSAAQAVLVPDLIPEAFQSRWRGQHYQLKLCGAGGGGFLLAYATDRVAAQKELADCTLFNF